jgi:hypothetical protein
MIHDWLNCFSWDPTLLCDKRPITQATVLKEEPVEPEVRRVSTAHEPYPSDNYYEWLYQDSGGEG